MRQRPRQKSRGRNQLPDSTLAGRTSSIPEFAVLNNAEESLKFRSKLEHFKKFTTEPGKVFNAGPSLHHLGVQHSIEIPASRSLLQKHELGQDESSWLLDAYNVRFIKQSQTPSTQNGKVESISFLGKPYREWKDVDKCLNASLDHNYKELLEVDQAKRSGNNSCFAHNRGPPRSRVGAPGQGPRVRFAESRQGTFGDLAERPESTAMALLQSTGATGGLQSSPVNLFEMQKIYYSNLNISKREDKMKGKQRYQPTMQAAAGIKQQADIARSLEGHQFQRARAAQSMTNTIADSPSKLPTLPSIGGARKGFPFH